MRISKKKLLVEIVLLVVIAGISLILSFPLRDYFIKISETPFHDTYFIVDGNLFTFFISIFPFLVFLIFLLRQFFDRFRNTYSSLILLTASASQVVFYSWSVISGTYLFLELGGLLNSNDGWTVIPPNQERASFMEPSVPVITIENVIQLYFVFFTFIIIITSFFLGKNSNRKNGIVGI